MSYIGSAAGIIPVSFSGVNSQSFNGDGSTVAFALNRPVATVKDVEVVVNNVQQSPYDGSYSVTGSTLTFSAAPSTGTANVYVTFRDQPVGTLTDTTAVSKSGDTMTGNLIVNANLGIGTSSPTTITNYSSLTLDGTSGGILDLRGGGTLGARIVGTASSMALETGGAAPMSFWTNNVQRMSIDSAGRVTMPYQPAFAAMRALQPDINTNQTVVFNSAFVNVGSHYNTSNGKFTAPINGLYEFQIFFLHRYRTGNGYVSVYPLKNGAVFLPGNNRIAYSQLNQAQEQTCGGVFYASLAAGDTMEILLEFSSSVTDMYGGDINSFCGKLIG